REVEFPVSHAPEKSVPLVRREPQDRPCGIPAVADADLAPGQAGHLDAVAGRVAQRALDPARSRRRPFVWTPECCAHVSPHWLVFRKGCLSGGGEPDGVSQRAAPTSSPPRSRDRHLAADRARTRG